MSTLKQSIELTPPSNKLGDSQKQRFEAMFQRCDACNGEGYSYRGGYMQKFKKNLSDANYTPCPYCKGTGKIKAIVTIEWLPYGDVIDVKEDNELRYVNYESNNM